jgi:hypothetical protein
MVFERPVLHEFGVQSAIGGVIDVLEKQPIQMRTERDGRFVTIDVDFGGCRGGSWKERQGEHDDAERVDGRRSNLFHAMFLSVSVSNVDQYSIGP